MDNNEGVVSEYCIRVNRLDGSLGMYAWCSAISEEEARKCVENDKIMKPGWIEKFGYESPDKWQVENLTEKHREERLKKNPQLDLF